MRPHIGQFSCALLLSLSSTASFAIPTNLLDNAGFETGDYSGWAVSGNSAQVGVATDGTVIQNVDDPFNPNFQNVRSGNYAGNALVKNGIDPVERIILTQTISVLQNQNVDVGFWMGNDSASGFGMSIDDLHTQIFIDGIGLLADSFLNFPTGSTSADFLEFGGSFNTGNRTSITVSYAFNGSGTSRVGISFDDLYFNSEAASVPEPAIVWLLGMGLGLIGFARRKA